MKTKSPQAIRISATDEVRKALVIAKKIYPTLSDPEIFKLGLANIVREQTNANHMREQKEIMAVASDSVGYDYLSDPREDIYDLDMGKKVHFE